MTLNLLTILAVTWIGSAPDGEDTAFSKSFIVDRPVLSATLRVSGLGFYEAYLNGSKIGDRVLDPSPTDYDKRVLFSEYALPDLVVGTNTLMIVLGHGWYDVRSQDVWDFDRAPWRNSPRTWAEVSVDYADGTHQKIETDETWAAVENTIVYDCIREGEVVDGSRTLGRSLGRKAHVVEAPRGRLENSAKMPGAKVVARLAPTSIRHLGRRNWLISFPETVSGRVNLTMRGLKKGEVVSLRYDENLTPSGEPAFSSAGDWENAQRDEARKIDCYFKRSGAPRSCPGLSGAQTDRFISGGGAIERFEPRFVYHGFRYVLIQGLADDLKEDDVRAEVIRSDFSSCGAFACSDPILTELVAMAKRSYLANFTDGIPTDCPHREKLGWTGDAWIASEFGLRFFAADAIYRKWLDDVVDTQKASGEISCIAPTPGWGYEWGNGPVFDAVLGMLPWNLYRYRNDKAVIAKLYPAFIKYLSYVKTRESEPDLVAWGLGDWNAKEESHKPSDEYVISCLYLKLRMLASEMSVLLSRMDDAREFAKGAERTRQALRRKYAKGRGVYDNGGQTAQALAVVCALASEDERDDVASRLVESVERTGRHVDFGLVGAKYVYRALSQIGRTDLAYEMVVNPTEPSMTKWIGKNGTLWEDWEGGFSKCHVMLSDFGAWAMETLAGIGAPGDSTRGKLRIAPAVIDRLDWVSAETDLPQGRVLSRWRRTAEGVEFAVTLPPEVPAELVLPDGEVRSLTSGENVVLMKTSQSASVAALDPATIWNRAELYRVPKSWKNQDPFTGEVTPLWIEGEPYRGKPTRVFAFLGLPEGASPTNKVPGVVLVHGGLGTAYPEWVRLWTRRGYAAITVDNCGQLPAMGRDGKWIANPDGGPRGWREEAAKQVGEPIRDQWMYHAIAASVRAHSYLRSLDCVDVSAVGVTGISWGGVQTCILAALDDRFAYAVPVYGCGFNSDPGGIMSPELHGINGTLWGRLWDPSLFLPYARIPFLWVDGTNDHAFSLEQVVRSADLLPSSSQFCTRLRMVHAHGAPGEAPAEILAFADRYARGGPDVVQVAEPSIENGIVSVAFEPGSRKVLRAEVLWTCDGEDVVAREREWKSADVSDFDGASKYLRMAVPQGAVELFINLIDAEGLIASSRVMKVERSK